MQISKIKLNDIQEVPWKNGNGTTRELAIEPPDAVFSECNFLWRLSSATLSGQSEFSKFAGYDRYLSLIDDESVTLKLEGAQDLQLRQNTWIRFSGESSVSVNVGQNQVSDLGLIVKRTGPQVQLMHLELNRKPKSFEIKASQFLLFVLKGDLRIEIFPDGGNCSAFAGDLLKIDHSGFDEYLIQMDTMSKSTLVAVIEVF